MVQKLLKWKPYLIVLLIGIVASLVATIVYSCLNQAPSLPSPKGELITVSLDDRYNLLQNEGYCTLQYLSNNKDNRLNITIDLNGLKAAHNYVLSINGKADKPGNDILKRFSKTDGEGYYDFDEIITDNQGNVHSDLVIRNLPSGIYEVKFLVKDKDDYKVVLLNDSLYFYID